MKANPMPGTLWPILLAVSSAGAVAAAPASAAEAARPAHGEILKDCPDCPEMIVVPAGQFMMGSPDSGAPPADADERPHHAVAIAVPYAISRTEITRGQFRRFVVATGYVGGTACIVWNGKSDVLEEGRSWDDAGFAQTDAHPAVCISWDDARAYANWLSEKTRRRYRLPSEAEWEYAARGGTSSDYFWGDSVDAGCGFANAADQTARDVYPGWPVMNCRDGFVHTAPVASFRPNGFGIYDTAGNVWEWVEDCDHDSYVGAPADGAAWGGNPGCRRIFRGASWHYFATSMRSANRHRDLPTVRYFSIGFRVVLDLE